MFDEDVNGRKIFVASLPKVKNIKSFYGILQGQCVTKKYPCKRFKWFYFSSKKLDGN